MIKHSFLLILIFLSSLFYGCSGQVLTEQEKTQVEFDKFVESIFCDTVTSNTINLHFTLANPKEYGITDANVTLGEYGYEYFLEEHSCIEEYYNTLLKFNYDQLSPDRQLTYDILEDSLSLDIASKDYVLFTEALSPLTGYQVQLPILMANYTFRNKTDIENYLILLEEFDEFFAKIMEFEKLKSEKGFFMPDFMANDVIEQCKTFVKDIDNNYLIETFNTTISEADWLSEDEKTAYSERNRQLVTINVKNAYSAIIDGLTGLLGTATNDAGLFYYDKGREYYALLVRDATGSSKSVRTLQTLTDEYIQNSLKEIYSLMISEPTLIDKLETYSFSYTEPSDILTHLKQQITEDFPLLPDTTCEICSVHESLEKNLSPAFFIVPPIDDTFNNVIFINKHYDNANLFTTLAHEGYPGHLYQNVYTASLNLPAIRSLLSYPGYTEGWATYVEYYSYNLDNLAENVAYTLALNDSATLGIYAYLDMGIHYDGWLYEDVLEYLKIFGFTDESLALKIYETILQNPANYLSYFIGYLEITELKETTMSQLNEDFNLKTFHTFLLEIGPAPFDIIADYINLRLTNSSDNNNTVSK